jgi:hypothetical protein
MPNPMTAAQVAEALRQLRAEYIAENSWFRFYTDGNDAMNPDKFAAAAGKAYEHVMTVNVPLLLGDTKIRSDAELVSNFGVSDAESASATSSSTSSATSMRSSIPVAGNLTRAGSTAAVSSASSSATSTSPSGGILDNKKWSPMLNDAFIMGGIHKKKQFVFSPVDDDASFVQSIMPPTRGADPKQQQIEAAIPGWRAFFQTKQYLLWDRGYPRVFVRELLGLHAFGYKAAPTSTNLSFEVIDPAAADNATFKEYCKELEDSGYYANDRVRVLKLLAEFLFGAANKNALDNVGA